MLVDREKLREIRDKNENKKIVVGLGSFDLFHYEHLRFIQSLRELGDIVVIGVKDDISVSEKENWRPVINQNWRAEIVDNIKGVDYVYICASSKTKIPECIKSEKGKKWWQLFYDLFESLRPDILYYEKNEKLFSARQLMSEYFNFSLIERERTELISTTKIIERIKNIK